MLTITRTEGIAALMSHPFTLFVLLLIIGASLLVAWLDRKPVRKRPMLTSDYLAAPDDVRVWRARHWLGGGRRG